MMPLRPRGIRRRTRRRALVGALTLLIAGASIACRRSDSDLLAAVSAQLAVDAATTRLELEVDIDHGVVHLSGETSTRAEQNAAIERARSVSGVKSVLSDLRLSDTAVARAVRQVLASDPMVGHIRIDVESRRGVVHLGSDATNRAEREKAVALAKQVDGVNGVDDRMR